MIHENVTQGRPRILVTRDEAGFVWEMRQTSLVPLRRSLIHFSTSAKARAAGDRVLARICPTHR